MLALFCLLGWLVSDNWGLLAATVFLVLVAAYHFVTSWPLTVDFLGRELKT